MAKTKMLIDDGLTMYKLLENNEKNDGGLDILFQEEHKDQKCRKRKNRKINDVPCHTRCTHDVGYDISTVKLCTLHPDICHTAAEVVFSVNKKYGLRIPALRLL